MLLKMLTDHLRSLEPLAFPVAGRDNGLLAYEKEVQRATGVFRFLNRKIKRATDSTDRAEHRRAARFAYCVFKRNRQFGFFQAIEQRSTCGLSFGSLTGQSAQDQAEHKYSCRKQPGVRLVDEKRDLDCRHHDECAEHQ